VDQNLSARVEDLLTPIAIHVCLYSYSFVCRCKRITVLALFAIECHSTVLIRRNVRCLR